MKVRTISLLLAVSLIVVSAPTAVATHCADGSHSDDEKPDPKNVTLRAAPAGPAVPSLLFLDNHGRWIVDPAEDERFNNRSGIAGCTVEVPDHNDNEAIDGADALNQALETGCITSWHGRNDDSCTDGSDIIVSELDGLEEHYPATFWLVQRNGHLADTGICDMKLEEDEELGFVYQ